MLTNFFVFFSDIERNCVLKTFYESITHVDSTISNVQFLHHHWEQPYNACTGPNCVYCLKGPQSSITFSSMNSDSGLTTINTISTSVGDGFIRFTIDKTVYRKFSKHSVIIHKKIMTILYLELLHPSCALFRLLKLFWVWFV